MRHDHCILCTSFLTWLGQPFWHTNAPHVRLGSKFTSEVWRQMICSFGRGPSADDGVPPPSEWRCRTAPFPAQGVADAQTRHHLEELPWVLLGLCTMPKDDLHASTAELVYGAPLRLPGEFVSQSIADATATPEMLQHLRRVVSRFQYTPAT